MTMLTTIVITFMVENQRRLLIQFSTTAAMKATIPKPKTIDTASFIGVKSIESSLFKALKNHNADFQHHAGA